MINALEEAILAEAREVVQKRKLLMEEIAEWSNRDIGGAFGTTVFYLPNLGINVAVYDHALTRRADRHGMLPEPSGLQLLQQKRAQSEAAHHESV